MLKSVSYSFINPHSHLVTEIDKIWSWGFHVQRTVRWPISPFNTMISLCKPNALLQKFTHKVHGNSLSNWVEGGGFNVRPWYMVFALGYVFGSMFVFWNLFMRVHICMGDRVKAPVCQNRGTKPLFGYFSYYDTYIRVVFGLISEAKIANGTEITSGWFHRS